MNFKTILITLGNHILAKANEYTNSKLNSKMDQDAAYTKNQSDGKYATKGTNYKLVDIVYPVGSIYMSAVNKDPSSFIGGTWTRLKGGFIYGAQSAFEANGNGTGTSTNSHTLTTNEMPKHSHHLGEKTFSGEGGGWASFKTGTAEMVGYQIYTNEVGGNQGHSHNIPYTSVFIWRRTA